MKDGKKTYEDNAIMLKEIRLSVKTQKGVRFQSLDKNVYVH